MYKVFINDKPLYLTSDANFRIKNYQQFSELKVDIILTQMQANETEGIILFAEDLTLAWKQFCSHFIFIEAAGGLVQNPKGEYLFIFRLGKWDLPKGKLEVGENIKECAIREVEEECNVTGLSILSEIPSTFHVYPFKGSYALKQSHWFLMTTNYNGELIPQTEEGIEQVVWLKKDSLKQILENTYASIAEVLKVIQN